MRAAEAFRDEAVERLPQGFGGRAAEHPLRRLVEKDNALVFIHGDDRVHRRRDNARQSLLALAQRLSACLLSVMSIAIPPMLVTLAILTRDGKFLTLISAEPRPRDLVVSTTSMPASL